MEQFTINYHYDGQVVITASNEMEAEEKFRQLSDKELIDGLIFEELIINSIE